MTDKFKCAICIEDIPKTDMYITPCNHEFCIGCIFEYLEHDRFSAVSEIPCPLCRADISSIIRGADYTPHRTSINDLGMFGMGLLGIAAIEIMRRRFNNTRVMRTRRVNHTHQPFEIELPMPDVEIESDTDIDD